MNTLALLALLATKHLLADFFWQTPYMLGKGKRIGWANPLAAHCSTHAMCTFAILVGITPWALPIAAAEFAAHFGIDRIKAHPDLGGRYKFPEPRFWQALGLDQWAHGMCYLAIAGVL